MQTKHEIALDELHILSDFYTRESITKFWERRSGTQYEKRIVFINTFWSTWVGILAVKSLKFEYQFLKMYQLNYVGTTHWARLRSRKETREYHVHSCYFFLAYKFHLFLGITMSHSEHTFFYPLNYSTESNSSIARNFFEIYFSIHLFRTETSCVYILPSQATPKIQRSSKL